MRLVTRAFIATCATLLLCLMCSGQTLRVQEPESSPELLSIYGGDSLPVFTEATWSCTYPVEDFEATVKEYEKAAKIVEIAPRQSLTYVDITASMAGTFAAQRSHDLGMRTSFTFSPNVLQIFLG